MIPYFREFCNSFFEFLTKFFHKNALFFSGSHRINRMFIYWKCIRYIMLYKEF